MCKTRKKLMVFCLVVLVFNISLSFVNASYISPHAYAKQHNQSQNNCGGFFSTPNGQSNLFSNWSSSHNNSWITNEMWTPFNGGNEWIETGDVCGAINGAYWSGHFVAVQKYNSSTKQYEYSEYTVGSSYPTGTHNFEVQYVGNNKWESYVDYNKTMSFSFNYTSSFDHCVGIESNDSDNYFTSGSYDSALQWKDSNNAWHNWTSATNGDSNSYNWVSSYSSSTNRITFTR
ncbi:hypothetical protein CLHUN_34110 [Ruminiclostridium hungatei]|uniref:Uncharacterized protein n=1 Tax=Ruminiclostridium hungatei TaxID=48256 RepID=A0A1V4SFV0_RUMHU|nr:hypothetical protein [Ruminiclostridium hungatei]OPX42759.1 hypothetical protein CLHUN_34110 [Ruminiclostridium hungatei]